MAEAPLAPRAEIRRFDIFAEWNRLKARHRYDLPEAAAQAKAYHLLLPGYHWCPEGFDPQD